MLYQCPGQKVVTGMASFLSNINIYIYVCVCVYKNTKKRRNKPKLKMEYNLIACTRPTVAMSRVS